MASETVQEHSASIVAGMNEAEKEIARSENVLAELRKSAVDGCAT